MKTTNLLAHFLRVTLILFLSVTGIAQEPIGGPYQTDSTTVVLLHFDNNLDNESSLTAKGVGHGGFSFFPQSVNPAFGPSLRLDNDAPGDSAFVSIMDTSALDLTGSWTIEGWINYFSFGFGSPGELGLVFKPGEVDYWRANYFVKYGEMDRWFIMGYHNAAQTATPIVRTPQNFGSPGVWYHFTFIRDTTRHLLILLIHNENRELLTFDVHSYDPVTEDPPIVTVQPLLIGWAGNRDTNRTFFDGLLDEIRISNIVRQFDIGPLIWDVTELGNQPTTVSEYPIKAKILNIYSPGVVQNASIHYSSGNSWLEIPMTQIDDSLYSAEIPQQPFASIVRYYVSAEDDQGRRRTFPSNAETDSVFLRFGIFQPQTRALHLSFEEGPGHIPQDSSFYGNPVTVWGNPTYFTNSAMGNYAIYLEGEQSYLEVDAPFPASPEFTLDFWFNMDSLESFRRMVSLGTGTGSSNYMVFLMPDSTLTAESSIDNDPIGASGLRDELKLDTRINAGQWYHAIYQLSSDSAWLQLYDANDMLLDEKRLSIIGPATRLDGKFRIGLLYNHTGYFGGYIDELKVYNYARDLTVGLEPDEKPGIPLRYELSQNYPNPFNAQTNIEYSLPVSGRVKITLYDILGRKVKTVLDEKKPAGQYELRFDAGHLSSGIYFYRLSAGDQALTRKFILLR